MLTLLAASLMVLGRARSSPSIQQPPSRLYVAPNNDNSRHNAQDELPMRSDTPDYLVPAASSGPGETLTVVDDHTFVRPNGETIALPRSDPNLPSDNDGTLSPFDPRRGVRRRPTLRLARRRSTVAGGRKRIHPRVHEAQGSPAGMSGVR